LYVYVTYLPRIHILTILYAALIVVLCALVVWIIHHTLNKALKKIPASIIKDLEISADLFIAIIGIAGIYSVLGVTLNIFLLLVLLILVGVFISTRDLLPTYMSTYVIRTTNAFKTGDWIEHKGIGGAVIRIDSLYTIIQTADGMLNYINNSTLFKDGFSVYSPLTNKYIDFKVVLAMNNYSETLINKIKAILNDTAQSTGKGEEPELAITNINEEKITIQIRIPVTNLKRENAIKNEVLNKIILEIKDLDQKINRP